MNSGIGQGQLEDYEVLETIGTGCFGTVSKIRRKCDGQVLVWKRIKYGLMSDKEKQLLVSEVNIIRKIKHPHVVKYYDHIVDNATADLYVITEYCPNGDLAALIRMRALEERSFEEAFVWKVFIQVMLAVYECHRGRQGCSIVHRDLKPANIFLDADMNAKLGDFGLARVLRKGDDTKPADLARTFCGTPFYMAPEQIGAKAYDESADVWALGCLLYEMCCLRLPFEASSHNELAMRIANGKFRDIPSTYSQHLHALVKALLQTKPDKRPSIEALLKVPHVAQRVIEVRLQYRLDAISRKEADVLKREAEVTRREKQLENRLEQFEMREKESEGALMAKFRACDELNKRLSQKERSLQALQEELAVKMKSVEALYRELQSTAPSSDQPPRQQLSALSMQSVSGSVSSPPLRLYGTPVTAPASAARHQLSPLVAANVGVSTKGRGSTSESGSSLDDSTLFDSDISSTAISTTPLKSFPEDTPTLLRQHSAVSAAFKAPLPHSRSRLVRGRQDVTIAVARTDPAHASKHMSRLCQRISYNHSSASLDERLENASVHYLATQTPAGPIERHNSCPATVAHPGSGDEPSLRNNSGLKLNTWQRRSTGSSPNVDMADSKPVYATLASAQATPSISARRVLEETTGATNNVPPSFTTSLNKAQQNRLPLAPTQSPRPGSDINGKSRRISLMGEPKGSENTNSQRPQTADSVLERALAAKIQSMRLGQPDRELPRSAGRTSGNYAGHNVGSTETTRKALITPSVSSSSELGALDVSSGSSDYTRRRLVFGQGPI